MSFRSLCLHSAHRSGIVVLAVYDILLIDGDSAGIVETKVYLKHHFMTNAMGRPKYFLGIKVAHQNTVYFFLSESML